MATYRVTNMYKEKDGTEIVAITGELNEIAELLRNDSALTVYENTIYSMTGYTLDGLIRAIKDGYSVKIEKC